MTVASFAYDGAPVRIVFGAGARDGLGDELDRLGMTQVVLIASASAREAADALACLLDHRLTWRVDGVGRHGPAQMMAEVTADAARVGADGVVTVGGGSATCLGRAVTRPGLPMVAVPTTYAGVELAPGGSAVTQPSTVVYDPELTLSLPPAVTAASGMHALANCLEALWAEGAGPLSDPLALEGARALAEALPTVAAEPENIKARSRVLVGACQGAMALAAAGTGLHHRICRVLAERFDLPDAPIHAAVLPHVVAYNEPALGPLATRMAVTVGAGRASTGLHELGARLGSATSLATLGLPEGGIPAAAAEVMGAPPPNPRPYDDAAVRSILHAAWECDLPE